MTTLQHTSDPLEAAKQDMRKVKTEADALCSVQHCSGSSHYKKGGALGMCRKHYLRMWRHGETKVKGTPKGSTMDFIKNVAMLFTQDKCLDWPFAKDRNGYGRLRSGGQTVFAHRLICEIFHGKPPTSKHFAIHSCGMGHKGCVNPHHIRWGTPRQNQLDRAVHGTSLRGERNSFSKITKFEALEIRRLKGRVAAIILSSRFGISVTQIRRIQAGSSWSWLENDAIHDEIMAMDRAMIERVYGVGGG